MYKEFILLLLITCAATQATNPTRRYISDQDWMRRMYTTNQKTIDSYDIDPWTSIELRSFSFGNYITVFGIGLAKFTYTQDKSQLSFQINNLQPWLFLNDILKVDRYNSFIEDFGGIKFSNQQKHINLQFLRSTYKSVYNNQYYLAGNTYSLTEASIKKIGAATGARILVKFQNGSVGKQGVLQITSNCMTSSTNYWQNQYATMKTINRGWNTNMPDYSQCDVAAQLKLMNLFDEAQQFRWYGENILAFYNIIGERLLYIQL